MPAAGSLSSRAAKVPAASESLSSAMEPPHEAEVTDTTDSSIKAADSAPFAIYTAEMWEQKISQLIAEGNIEGAKTEIKALKQHYPQHQINPALLEKINHLHE